MSRRIDDYRIVERARAKDTSQWRSVEEVVQEDRIVKNLEAAAFSLICRWM